MLDTQRQGDRWALGFVALGIVGPWWLPLMGNSIPTFYKEWLAVVSFGFAGLCLMPVDQARPNLLRSPVVLAAAALLVVLAVQGVVMEGVWRKAALTAFGAAFFVYCIAIGREMGSRLQPRGFDVLAGCVLIAALGSCALAFLQLAGLDARLPFVLAKSGDRLYGNVAQANHFADLLWLGSIAAAHLTATKRMSIATTAATVLAMHVGSALSGSRAVWLYALLLGVFAIVLLRRPRKLYSRRLAWAFAAIVVAYAAVVGGLAVSGVLDRAGIVSAERRFVNGNGDESTQQRLWFWNAGMATALHHPLIGVGAGQLPGHARELAMASDSAPSRATDAHAHNIFIQFAAEQGIPLALLAAACLAIWLRRAGRVIFRGDGAAALAMIGVILIHANLEHPLAYLYFVALIGLLVGYVDETTSPGDVSMQPSQGIQTLRIAGFAVVALAAVAYVNFQTLEHAMKPISDQVRTGAAPQLSLDMRSRLDAVPAWSPYRDWAEALSLVAVVPTAANATPLADRCERAVMMGPTPFVLARCATVMQVAGRPERASSFANSICRFYPESDSVLAQSMEFVERSSPTAGNVASACIRRVN